MPLKQQWDDLVSQIANKISLDELTTRRLMSVQVKCSEGRKYRSLLVVPMSIDPVGYNRTGVVEVTFDVALFKCTKKLILQHYTSRIVQTLLYANKGYRMAWTGPEFQQLLKQLGTSWPQDITGDTKTRDRRSGEPFRRVEVR